MRGEATLNGSWSCAMMALHVAAACGFTMAQGRRNQTAYCPAVALYPRRKPADYASLIRLRSLACVLEHRQQLLVQRLVAGGDVALREHGVVSVEVGDVAARFAHHQ